MNDPRYNTARWRQLRRTIRARDGWCCTVYGCLNTGPLHVDHIHEVSDGGDFWNPANLTTLCKPHHDAKTMTVRAQRQQRVSPNA